MENQLNDYYSIICIYPFECQVTECCDIITYPNWKCWVNYVSLDFKTSAICVQSSDVFMLCSSTM